MPSSTASTEMVAVGQTSATTPATTASTPLISGQYQPGVSRRRRIAKTISMTPVTSSPTPTTTASAHSVTPGQAMAMMALVEFLRVYY